MLKGLCAWCGQQVYGGEVVVGADQDHEDEGAAGGAAEVLCGRALERETAGEETVR